MMQFQHTKLQVGVYIGYLSVYIFFYSQTYSASYFEEPSLWSLNKVFRYYKRNLRRFSYLLRSGELNQIIRPGKFSTQPVNNIEKILRFKDVHFEGIINATSHK